MSSHQWNCHLSALLTTALSETLSSQDVQKYWVGGGAWHQGDQNRCDSEPAQYAFLLFSCLRLAVSGKSCISYIYRSLKAKLFSPLTLK